MSLHSVATLWRHRNSSKLWAGQTILQFGSQITLLALPLTDCARDVLFFAIPLAALLNRLPIGLVSVVALLVGILTGFFDVAYRSVLPAPVGWEQLPAIRGETRRSPCIPFGH